MRKPLWTPSKERIEQANITRFIALVNKRHSLRIDSYKELYKWSIEKIPDFWEAMWEFADIRASQGYQKVVDDLSKFPGAKWFIGAKLNFAENFLRHRDDNFAFVSKAETEKTTKTTYAELYGNVAGLAKSLRLLGIASGDRVAAYMPNLPETATAMLATTSLGATWSSCGTELGPQAVIDRLSQIQPKVLFTVAG